MNVQLLLRSRIEVISGIESSSDIRAMFEGWDAWSQTEEAQQYLLSLYRKHGAMQPVPEFRITCIIHSRNWKYTDAWKERLTLQQTLYVSPQLQGRVETTTLDALSAVIDNDLGINHPVWHRGQDLLGDVRRRWVSADTPHARAFDQEVQQLVTYPLFA